MIRRIEDPRIINRFANHPEINPHIGGVPCDFAPAMRKTATYLFGEHGGFCFEWCAPGTYETHVMITEAGRGKWALKAWAEAVAILKPERLWCRITEAHVACFARLCGFHEVGSMTLYSGDEAGLWRIFEWRNACPL